MKKGIPCSLNYRYRPVDKNAVRVVFFKGDHWYPTLPKGGGSVLATPPRISHQSVGRHPDVTGMRRGSLVALYHHHTNHNGTEFWVMRCDCGMYAFRAIRGWARRVNVFDQCLVCETRNGLTKTGKSHATHALRYARWVSRMVEYGFTAEQCELIKKYNLPADNLEWLMGALKEITGGAA